MLRAFSLALNQIGVPAILKVLAKSLAITLVLCVLFGWAAGYGAQWAIKAYQGPGQDTYSGVLQGLGVLLMLFFGFRVIAIPVIGFFADEIVAAVERRYYPAEAAEAQRVGVAVSMRLGLMSAARALLFNLLALPFYLILLVTAIGPLALFLLINALLLGRDLGEMVAVRHLAPTQMKQWLSENRMQRLIVGGATTALFMVPVANIIAPIIGAAMATHMFHSARNRGIG